MISAAFFGIFAALTVFSAVAVAVKTNLVQSVFMLLVTFMGIAALFLLLEADFLAVTQILIYVGGILTLFLFGVLLSQKRGKKFLTTGVHYKKRSLVFVLLLAASLVWMVFKEKDLFHTNYSTASPAYVIGSGIMTKYLIPFEFAGILLLVVLAGVLALISTVRYK